jgi:hypothetical protein
MEESDIDKDRTGGLNEYRVFALRRIAFQEYSEWQKQLL